MNFTDLITGLRCDLEDVEVVTGRPGEWLQITGTHKCFNADGTTTYYPVWAVVLLDGQVRVIVENNPGGKLTSRLTWAIQSTVDFARATWVIPMGEPV